jgi:phosphoribosylformimino-5-aminoimidazole carboxamide ribotide isomerase
VILYPAIDIRGGRAVRLIQGDYEREIAYDADPTVAARRWVDDGAEYLHVVDLDGARTGEPANLEQVARIAAVVDVPLQLGGGLRDAEAIAAAFDAGAERVVLGTAALSDPAFLQAVLERYAERVVVSVDARGGKVALRGWTDESELDAAETVIGLAERGVTRIVFTTVELDGTMEGPGIKQLRSVAGRLTESSGDTKLIASGGVGDLSDLRTLACLAPSVVDGVIVGRALYEQRFSVKRARSVLERD